MALHEFVTRGQQHPWFCMNLLQGALGLLWPRGRFFFLHDFVADKQQSLAFYECIGWTTDLILREVVV